MSFVEFVGFIISFGAMIFLVLRRFFEERQKRQNPEEYARKEKIKEENLRRFMRERGIATGDDDDDDDEKDEEDFPVEMRRKPAPPAPPKKISKPQQSQQSQQSQQAFIKLREAQKLQAAPAPQKKAQDFYQGNYGSETASAKKRNLAASDVEHAMHHDFKPADSYEVIRVERITAANRLISGLRSPQDMVILKEILDKPLSMRKESET